MSGMKDSNKSKEEVEMETNLIAYIPIVGAIWATRKGNDRQIDIAIKVNITFAIACAITALIMVMIDTL